MKKRREGKYKPKMNKWIVESSQMRCSESTNEIKEREKKRSSYLDDGEANFVVDLFG